MIIDLWKKLNAILDKIASFLASPFLLVIRLYWGWQFFIAGKGKLMDIETNIERFVGWGIPFPKLNVILAGSTECFGGLFLLVGLFSRVVSIPLIFTMVVAYMTASKLVVQGIFSDPDAFVSAAPFLFMLAAVIVFIFGPGAISVDRWIQKRAR